MIGWAIETFIATTLLMLLVLAIRAPVRKAFGANIAYALWLLPVFRLVLPPLPESWTEQAAAPVAAAGEAITVYVIEPMGAAPQAGAEGSFGLLMALLLVWGVGAAVFLAYHLISHSRFCSKLLRAARVDRTVAEGKVRVIETDAAHGPLAFGIWRKYVAFPRDFSERYDELERDLALAHELGHHVRGDLIANWVALVVLALHWFNPVAWKAFRAFRADQEMACDALVLAGRHQALRHAYGRAIVKSAHGGAVSAACHLHTINELKGRLRMLSKTRKFSPARIGTGLIGVGAISLAALGLTASSQAATRITDKVGATFGVDFAAQETPAAPDAPEAPDAHKAHKEHKEVRTFVFRSDDDKDGHKDGKHKKVIVLRSGEKVEGVDMAAIEASIPEIKSLNCKDDGHGKHSGDHMVMVEPKSGDGKKKIIICTNRIEKMAAMSADMAEKHKKMGLDAALMGLRMARRSIEMQTELSAEQKAAALKGIDEALAEVSKEAHDD